MHDYWGYEKADGRERTDKAIREHCIEIISQLTGRLGNSLKAEQEEDQQRLDTLVANAKKNLLIIGDSLRNPTYSGTSFFTAKAPFNDALNRIYDLEKLMLDALLNISGELGGLDKGELSKDQFEASFLQIQDFLDDINQSLFEREALILGDM
ncbi:MAG: hypothetical protein GXO75_13405 [Calditrichaeota bacterium]|nr:hypothetical protein [Calditrichota bacterium]